MDRSQIRELMAVGETAEVDPQDTRIAALAQLAAAMGSPPPARGEPVREVLARLGDNWSALILKVLAGGTYRHATLKRVIGALSFEGEISQRMLTLRLRALERDGFVRRYEQPTVPPRVTYELTPMDADLAQELDRLIAWVEMHKSQIEAARLAFGPLDTD